PPEDVRGDVDHTPGNVIAWQLVLLPRPFDRPPIIRTVMVDGRRGILADLLKCSGPHASLVEEAVSPEREVRGLVAVDDHQSDEIAEVLVRDAFNIYEQFLATSHQQGSGFVLARSSSGIFQTRFVRGYLGTHEQPFGRNRERLAGGAGG